MKAAFAPATQPTLQPSTAPADGTGPGRTDRVALSLARHRNAQAPRTQPAIDPMLGPVQRTAFPSCAASSPASRLGPMRRPSPRTALALRYAQHWSIRQPRRLASRRAGATADRPAPARSAPPAMPATSRPKRSGSRRGRNSRSAVWVTNPPGIRPPRCRPSQAGRPRRTSHTQPARLTRRSGPSAP